MIWCEKTVDLRLKRVSANAAVSPRCLCVPSFGSLAVGRTQFCFVWFSGQICFVKESVPVSAERSDAACIKTGTRNIVILFFCSQILKNSRLCYVSLIGKFQLSLFA